MKRNIFGEPKPIGMSQIISALEEFETSGDECSAILNYDNEEGDFQGYSAEIYDDSDNLIFSTLGYEIKENLINDLNGVGIDLSSISEY